MNVLVCISVVPDTTSKINFKEDNKKFDENGIQFIINPNDEFALTRAVWLQQKQGATVTVLTVGNAATEVTLRKCLAIGADKAVRIDTEPTDGFAVASEINAFCKQQSFDLILVGRESIDYNGGMVGGILATLLDIPFVVNCTRLEIADGKATMQREVDGGKETLSSSLPIVIAGQKGLVEESDLIIPNMRGIMQARQKPLEVVPPQNAETATHIDHFEKPAAKGDVKLVDADDLDTLIDLLQNEAKVL